METTPSTISPVMEFLSANWQYIVPLIGWVAARLIPTQKNLDLVEMVLSFIGKLIPNRRVDSLGNNVKAKQ